MKKLLSLFIATSLAAGGSLFAEDAKKPSNEKCPVSGKAVDSEQVSVYTKVVGFCCEKCVAKFKKDSSGAVEKIAAAKAGHVNSKCPISDKDIDAEATVVHNGATVALCCEKCVKKFKGSPAETFKKVKMDVVANDKCPYSGKALDNDTTTVFTLNVGFCCEKCKGKFDKNPDKLISKVELKKAS